MIEYEIEDFNFVEDGSIEFNGWRFTRENSIGRISPELFEELISARQDIMNRAASTNKRYETVLQEAITKIGAKESLPLRVVNDIVDVVRHINASHGS